MALHVDRCLARLAQHDRKVQMSVQQMEAGVVVHDQDIRNHGVSFLARRIGRLASLDEARDTAVTCKPATAPRSGFAPYDPGDADGENDRR